MDQKAFVCRIRLGCLLAALVIGAAGRHHFVVDAETMGKIPEFYASFLRLFSTDNFLLLELPSLLGALVAVYLLALAGEKISGAVGMYAPAIFLAAPWTVSVLRFPEVMAFGWIPAVALLLLPGKGKWIVGGVGGLGLAMLALWLNKGADVYYRYAVAVAMIWPWISLMLGGWLSGPWKSTISWKAGWGFLWIYRLLPLLAVLGMLLLSGYIRKNNLEIALPMLIPSLVLAMLCLGGIGAGKYFKAVWRKLFYIGIGGAALAVFYLMTLEPYCWSLNS